MEEIIRPAQQQARSQNTDALSALFSSLGGNAGSGSGNADSLSARSDASAGGLGNLMQVTTGIMASTLWQYGMHSLD